jgi:hypothetical protein
MSLEVPSTIMLVGTVVVVALAVRHACDIASTGFAVLDILVARLAVSAKELAKHLDHFAMECRHFTSELAFLARSAVDAFLALLPLLVIIGAIVLMASSF